MKQFWVIVCDMFFYRNFKWLSPIIKWEIYFITFHSGLQFGSFEKFGKLKSLNMSSRMSISQASVGSGALSHVYIHHPALRCNIPESRGLFYDDANRLLICTTSSQVFFSFPLKCFIWFCFNRNCYLPLAWWSISFSDFPIFLFRSFHGKHPPLIQTYLLQLIL